MDQKTCFKCGIEQLLSNFYRHPQMADGRVNKCKECNKKDVQTNYKKNRKHFVEYDRGRNRSPERVESRRKYQEWLSAAEPERKKEYQRQSYLRNAEKKHQKQREDRELFPTKNKARTALSNAVRDKRIIRLPCERCGDINSHGHHEDYTKPLEVIWLCPLHHRARHKELKELGIEIKS